MVVASSNIHRRVGRRVEDLVDRNRYTRVIRVLVESGSLYTTTIVVFFICVVNNLVGSIQR